MPTNERHSERSRRRYLVAGIVGLCVLSGAVGGALNRNFGTSDYTLSYADFITIMLTAVSVLMTVLAIFLAVFGFIGWNSIEQKVHAKTEDFLASGFEKGNRLDNMVASKVAEAIEIKTVEMMFNGIESLEEADDDKSGAV